MTFASGSQRLGKLSDLPIGDASEAAFQAAVEAHGLACTGPESFAPGDATFHAAGRSIAPLRTAPSACAR